MKSIVLLVCLTFAATLLSAQSQPAKAAPAKSAKQDDKTTEEPKIPGTVIPRAKGGYLGLTIEEGTFRLAFYGKDKKPANADADQAVMRWLVKYQKSDERTSLTRTGDGKALGGGKVVRPPYAFKLFLTLFTGEGEYLQTDENYVIDFQG